MTTTYKWIETYKAALLETDWSKMQERIETAESALRQRKHEFDLNHGGTSEENHAIADAISGLAVLRNDLVKWSEQERSKSDTSSPV
jgi:hypothetical protein